MEARCPRCFLEIVKFLTWREVLLSFSKVCHLFAEVGADDEVWYHFLEQRDCESPYALLAPTPKGHFRLTTQRFLPILTPTKLVEYHLTSGERIEHRLKGSNKITHTSVWVWLPGDEIFCAGAEQHALVYRIRPPEYEVESLPSMTQQRGWFAALSYRGFVYVFGGFYTGWQFTKKCEKFDLQHNQWVALPDMERARSSFNATRWRTQVFVCGGWENIYSEVFDLQTERFSPLPLQLAQSQRTLCWASDDVLFILQNTVVYKWSISKKEVSVPQQVSQLKSCIWTNTPPVESRGKLFYLVWDNGCGYSFDLATYEVAQVLPNLFPSIYP